MNVIRVFAFGLCVVLSGCAANTVSMQAKTAKEPQEEDVAIIKRVNSSRLKGKVVITSAKKFEDGNMLTAQVGLRSRVNKSLKLQYRFIWFTDSGRQLDTGDAWMPFLLYGKEETYLKATAPDPRAAEYSVDIRFQD
jgi:uncharacterized protein YcfL